MGRKSTHLAFIGWLIFLSGSVLMAGQQTTAAEGNTAQQTSPTSTLMGAPPPPPTDANRPQPVPAGTALRVTLRTLLSDKTNKVGDPFNAKVTYPVTANGQEIIPVGSMVDGHVAFIRESGRVKGRAEMRLVVDKVTTPDDVVYPLSSILQEAHDVNCSKGTVGSKVGDNGKSNEEGTITGCGKSGKEAAKDAAIGAGIGTMGGLSVGMATRGGCDYYGYCWPSSGPSMGADIGYGAAIGAGTALVYKLFQHQKHIILVQGTPLTFVVNRTTDADSQPAAEPAQPAADN